MAPFNKPTVVLTGFKERPESLLAQGDRLYIGTAAGNVHIYDLHDETSEDASPTMTLVETKQAISRKAIDQLGYIKDINSLVVLSESIPTLYPLPSFSPPTPLAKAKGALSFAIHSSVHNAPRPVAPDASDPSRSGGFDPAKDPIPIPTMVTTLVIGCRRKVVVYTWRDGEAQEVKETLLPHSPRAVAFMDPFHVCLAYPATEYAIFSLEDSTTVDVATPAPIPTASSSTGLGMGAFSGLSGYMSLGRGKAVKPGLVRVGEGEVVVVKENQGFVLAVDGTTKAHSINWPSQPEEIAYVNPYIFSFLPPGTVPLSDETSNGSDRSSPIPTSTSLQAPQGQTPASLIQAPVVQVISSINALPVQTLAFPFSQPFTSSSTISVANISLRLLTTTIPSTPSNAAMATTASKNPSPLFLLSAPLDRTLAAAEGTTIWRFTMRDWDAQIDELVERGSYTDALALLERVEGPGKSPKRTLILALNAVSQFRAGKYDDAINLFLELDVNPAKVVALYPERVAGRLAVGREEWVALFGGPTAKVKEELSSGGAKAESSAGDKGKAEDAVSTKSSDGGRKESGSKERLPRSIERSPSPAGSLRARTKTSFGALLPSAVSKDDDVASLSGRKKGKVIGASFFLLVLVAIVTCPLPASILDPRRHITCADDSTRSLETLWRYLTSLRPKLAGVLSSSHHITPSQSHLFPTLSSTAPASLYALPSGVPLTTLSEEELVKRAQIVDTALFKSYLIGRPSMLGPLCRLPNWCDVEEVEEELRAREKYAELIFLYNGKKMHAKALKLLQQLSNKEDDARDKARPTISYLRKLGPEYIDQIFESAHWVFEQDQVMAFKIFTSDDVELPRGPVTDYLERIDPQIASQYLEYLIEEKEEQSVSFHDRLAELYLGITTGAKKKGDEKKRGEMYAKLVRFIETTERYQPDRLYGLLSEDLYEARAILLGRMSRHEHALELYLLPPLVTAQDVKPFLAQALRAPVFDNCVVREVNKARREGVERRLMVLESRRVKVTDSRICPQCHKRLGNSVIAVHAPRGRVTHYQCREAFSSKLKAGHWS
ncbi:hypothetical protein BU15DRAFT_89236 [Melanogaster broomeanus]|nr:hypothetical protein BU15DRAFT_89236 [Melanogaster broomeanus]